MIQLDLSNHKKLIENQIYRYTFNYALKEWSKHGDWRTYVSKSVQDWLIENIGLPITAFRRYDLVQYPAITERAMPIIKTEDDWEKHNPLLPGEHNWHFKNNVLSFATAEQATHFKLVWF